MSVWLRRLLAARQPSVSSFPLPPTLKCCCWTKGASFKHAYLPYSLAAQRASAGLNVRGGRGARNFSEQPEPPTMVEPRRVVSYEEVRRHADAAADPERALIIDVREPHELRDTGQIPSSINIPLASVGSALSGSDEEFRRRFAREKPPEQRELIFYCQSGRRSARALAEALQLGYTNSKTYMGSWQEWSSKQK